MYSYFIPNAALETHTVSSTGFVVDKLVDGTEIIFDYETKKCLKRKDQLFDRLELDDEMLNKAIKEIELRFKKQHRRTMK